MYRQEIFGGVFSIVPCIGNVSVVICIFSPRMTIPIVVVVLPVVSSYQTMLICACGVPIKFAVGDGTINDVPYPSKDDFPPLGKHLDVA